MSNVFFMLHWPLIKIIWMYKNFAKTLQFIAFFNQIFFDDVHFTENAELKLSLEFVRTNLYNIVLFTELVDTVKFKKFKTFSKFLNSYASKFWSKVTQYSVVNFNPITYPGLTIGYPFNRLCRIGFRLAYDEYYSHITLTTELENIRSQCNSSSILCAAGGLVNTDILTLVSCANCHSVLTIKSPSTAVHLGSSHWYLTPNQSFGFAPNSTINFSPGDSFDPASLFRLSWHLDKYNKFITLIIQHAKIDFLCVKFAGCRFKKSESKAYIKFSSLAERLILYLMPLLPFCLISTWLSN
ncbi:hypothetical protein BpHYR1_023356 [Brachionus plicatilis]|uniref:Uncharacterized protein n=1 Tax=Brachionus plicatilis TaxID=10195 RepID=A0A3M7SQB2_BRAPC|nr:hypothetical protein BpHYR1_023356 [Brachionus plicatilis]